jgi:putative ABC transport system permease protein
MLGGLWQDARYALRALARSPGFSAIAIASLALGIGVNSAIFTLVSATTFPDLPYRDADRLVDVHEVSPELCAGCAVGTSFATFRDWRTQARSFVGMGAYQEASVALAAGAEPERVSAAYVSAELFALLGVTPDAGRLMTAADDRKGAERVALIGHETWTRHFNADPAAIGSSVRVDGEIATVIGVMPAGFAFPDFADVWLPITPVADSAARSDRSVGVLARLRDGVTLEQARTEIAVLTRGIAASEPEAMRNWSGAVTTLRDDLRNDSGPPFLILLGASALVLIIACANLVNLMLARASRRLRDVAVRAAMGASGGQLARQLLIESLMLAAIGAALGILIAVWLVDLATQFLPSDIPFWIQFDIDWRVLTFTVGLALVTGLAVGLVPAVHTRRVQVHEILKDSARGATPGRRQSWLRAGLVVSEVALSLMLLSGAGLLIKTLMRANASRDLGYEPRGVLSASAELTGRRFDDPRQAALAVDALLARLRDAPTVEGAAVTTSRFLGTFVGTEGRMTLDGSSTAVPDAIVPRFATFVTPEYFDVLRLPLRRGRAILASDDAAAPGVLVVNEAAAALLWPNRDALGRQVKLGAPNENVPWLTVVGIVGNTTVNPLSPRVPPLVYAAFAQAPSRDVAILTRTRGEPAAFAPELRRIAVDVIPDTPLTGVLPMSDQTAQWLAPIRFMMRLLIGLAALALVLAAMGIYGVLSYVVAQRAPEIGIRVALGASTRRIVPLILRQGAVLAGLGILIGVAGALASAQVLRSLLFGASATDPLVLVLVSFALLTIALLACVVPVRRALRVDPVDALRVE